MFDKDIAATGTSPDDVCTALIDSMTDEDSEFLTVYYGADVSEEDAQALEDALSTQYDDLEVSVQYGGQALYYYIISVE
jgi:dihydroxyacetone kinase-like predicted kinase